MDPAAVFVLVTFLCSAQAPAASPAASPADQSRGLWADAALIAGGQSLDAGTTLYGLRHGLTESNPMVGGSPSTASVLAIKVGIVAVAVTFCYLARRAGHPRIARVVAIAVGALGGFAGTANARLM